MWTVAANVTENVPVVAWSQALVAIGTVIAILTGLLAILDKFRKWIDRRIVSMMNELTKRVDGTDSRILDHEQRISRLEGKQDA